MSPPRLAIIPILSRVRSPLSKACGALIVCFRTCPCPKIGSHFWETCCDICLRIPAICRQLVDMADSFVSYRILSLMKRYPLGQVRCRALLLSEFSSEIF
ncbi:hypothetical protein DK867_22485 [Ochrobactrum sp. POC9]|nr:hypothetical protein DK867_22485 [Ochrobactrum sp. POC9]